MPSSKNNLHNIMENQKGNNHSKLQLAQDDVRGNLSEEN